MTQVAALGKETFRLRDAWGIADHPDRRASASHGIRPEIWHLKAVENHSAK
jgi:hypothetical protein